MHGTEIRARFPLVWLPSKAEGSSVGYAKRVAYETHSCVAGGGSCLVRAGFRALLQGLREIEIVAEAGNGKDALRSVEAHQPDVVLLDIAIPETERFRK